MNNDSLRWYRSKVDWWIAALLCVPPIAMFAVSGAVLFGEKRSEWPMAVIAILFVCGIYFGLVFPMRYGIGDGKLVVRFGQCRQSIALQDVLEVRPTRNPLSSPALSLDRLHVQYGQGFFKAVMISPADRDQFLADLAAAAGLERDGVRWVRR